ncbi:MAG: lipopolysaccharide biosynthesis protein [Bacteroides sp.]|nr:lipopolysaccharide biosynthesis protein [Bacteroides sp.]
MAHADDGELKRAVARTMKWNIIDRVATQVLYAVTGIVLARLLSQEDFGLVGAVMVFQAFASLFVDSGFSSALIQRKNPSHEDYSTVFWFNLGMAVVLYAILWFAAPWIAQWFEGDMRIVPLGRVMFLSFIVNAASIVQTNRLMKRMDTKMIAVSSSLGLTAGAVVGIALALGGFGAWAIVWQTITIGLVKGAVLWATGHWRPLMSFSFTILRSFFAVGSGVMASSFLNTLFQNIYSFFIGNRAGLASLGYYTQADKWSKMGVMSISQVLTSSFLPVLSKFQDDRERFAASTAKMNRLTAYLLFPAMGFLGVMATPIFHSLFGAKWDPSIVLFQILLLRGVFTVLVSLYNNYILALGRSRLLVWTEALRDGIALAAIIVTLPMIALSSPADPTEGLRIFLIGQVLASAVTWVVTLVITVRLTARSVLSFVRDLLPYMGLTAVAMAVMGLLLDWQVSPWIAAAAQLAVGAVIYFGANAALGSKIQADALAMIMRRR